MTGDDPVLASVGALPRLEGNDARAELTRLRCQRMLARRRRVRPPALQSIVGVLVSAGISIVFLVDVVRRALVLMRP